MARMTAKQSQVNVAPIVETVVGQSKKLLFGYGCRHPKAYLLERTSQVFS